MLLWPRRELSCSSENFLCLLTKNISVTKLTFQDPLLQLFVILPDHMTKPRKSWFPFLLAFYSLTSPRSHSEKKKNLSPQFLLVFPIIREKLPLHYISTDRTSSSHRNMCAVATGASLCPEWMVWYRLTRLCMCLCL